MAARNGDNGRAAEVKHWAWGTEIGTLEDTELGVLGSGYGSRNTGLEIRTGGNWDSGAGALTTLQKRTLSEGH